MKPVMSLATSETVSKIFSNSCLDIYPKSKATYNWLLVSEAYPLAM